VDAEYKRLRRLVIIFAILVLLVFFAAIVYGSYELRHLRAQIADRPAQAERVIEKPITLEPIQGIQGIQGVEGPKGDPAPIVPGPPGPVGAPGTNGKDGVDGKDGEDGKDGSNGREIELRKNPESLETEWRYVGTKIWQVVEVVE